MKSRTFIKLWWTRWCEKVMKIWKFWRRAIKNRRKMRTLSPTLFMLNFFTLLPAKSQNPFPSLLQLSRDTSKSATFKLSQTKVII
jgi:hypothetical protein